MVDNVFLYPSNGGTSNTNINTFPVNDLDHWTVLDEGVGPSDSDWLALKGGDEGFPLNDNLFTSYVSNLLLQNSDHRVALTSSGTNLHSFINLRIEPGYDGSLPFDNYSYPVVNIGLQDVDGNTLGSTGRYLCDNTLIDTYKIPLDIDSNWDFNNYTNMSISIAPVVDNSDIDSDSNYIDGVKFHAIELHFSGVPIAHSGLSLFIQVPELCTNVWPYSDYDVPGKDTLVSGWYGYDMTVSGSEYLQTSPLWPRLAENPDHHVVDSDGMWFNNSWNTSSTYFEHIYGGTALTEIDRIGSGTLTFRARATSDSYIELTDTSQFNSVQLDTLVYDDNVTGPPDTELDPKMTLDNGPYGPAPNAWKTDSSFLTSTLSATSGQVIHRLNHINSGSIYYYTNITTTEGLILEDWNDAVGDYVFPSGDSFTDLDLTVLNSNFEDMTTFAASNNREAHLFGRIVKRVSDTEFSGMGPWNSVQVPNFQTGDSVSNLRTRLPLSCYSGLSVPVTDFSKITPGSGTYAINVYGSGVTPASTSHPGWFKLNKIGVSPIDTGIEGFNVDNFLLRDDSNNVLYSSVVSVPVQSSVFQSYEIPFVFDSVIEDPPFSLDNYKVRLDITEIADSGINNMEFSLLQLELCEQPAFSYAPTGMPLFVDGLGATNDNLDLFLFNNKEDKELDLYIFGAHLDNSGMDLYTQSANFDINFQSLYIDAIDTDTNAMTLYTQSDLELLTADLFVEGDLPTNSGITLFTESFLPSNSSISLFTDGVLADTDSIPLFLQTDPLLDDNDNLNLFMYVSETGQSGLFDSMNLFMSAEPVANDNHPLYIHGFADPVAFNQGIPLFLQRLEGVAGELGITNTTTLYMSNDWTASTSGLDMYMSAPSGTLGAIPVNGAAPLFMARDIESTDAHMSLYIPGPSGLTDTMTFFIEGGNSSVNDNLTMFIPSQITPNNNIEFYTHGY